MTVLTAQAPPRLRTRYFHTAISILAVVMILIGFARSYYLKPLFATPPLSPLLHLHGLVMTAWLALLVVQPSLVAARRTDLHRKLGVFGAFLAIAVVILGVATAIASARAGRAPPGLQPLQFMVVPLGDALIFPILIGAALHYRRRPELHKRLMLVATIAILPPGVGRWPWFSAPTPLQFFGIPDLLLIACIAYDVARTRRLSPAYLWGGLLLIGSHPLRLILAETSAWMGFARWITGA